MCAIYGIIKNEGEVISKEVLVHLFNEASAYGRHSTGIAYKAGGNTKVVKQAVNHSRFLKLQDASVSEATASHVILGHTRFATQGSVVSRNAHPFLHTKENGKSIIFAHNGIIHNDNKFGEFTVDSECLGHLIEKQDISDAHGSIGLVWIEGGELWVYRRNQSLYAYGAETKDGVKFGLVVSRESMVKPSDLEKVGVKLLCEYTYEVGKAYKLTPDNMYMYWEDSKIVDVTSYEHLSYRGGVYCGG